MKKLFLIFFTAFFAVIFLAKPAFAADSKILMAGTSAVLKNEFLLMTKDCRKEKLENFLKSYNSPFSSQAPELVKVADKYKIDWKLIPAISGIESSFGREMPASSFNAYGWVNGNYKFDSWESSFEEVAKTLKEKYIDRGLDTPEKIGPVYAPPSKSWASKVRYFMNEITNYKTEGCFDSLTLTI